MRIYSMTATFGKLDHQTLTLQPGLNVVEAPNEWGKSTWCAFLLAMLYGIDTSARSRRDSLADKERYAPWSGQPMTGRMQLQWGDRDITIERGPKGRIPFGQFLAYETHTHLPVAELTADNCGQQLLGVEREVFLRSGFLRLADLPVTQDEALRRRLNALVTTGDESGASDLLAQKLRDLKNRCRHNKTGLLPQVQAQQQQLQSQLNELNQLKQQQADLMQEQAKLQNAVEALQNHLVSLQYAHACQTKAHLEKAQQALEAAQAKQQQLDAQCHLLPSRESIRLEMERLSQLQQQLELLQAEEAQLPPPAEAPVPPAVFAGMTPGEAIEKVRQDLVEYAGLCKPTPPLFLILAICALLGAVAIAFIHWIPAVVVLLSAVVFAELYRRSRRNQLRRRQQLLAPYGSHAPNTWMQLATTYRQQTTQWQEQQAQRQVDQAQLQTRRSTLLQAISQLTAGQTVSHAYNRKNQQLLLLDEQEDAAVLCQQAESHVHTLQQLVVEADPPARPDTLTLTQEETERALQQAAFAQHSLQNRLGQCQGQLERMDDRQHLESELAQVNGRLARLEDMYAALSLAQDTLATAAMELQRRFAPRIASRTKQLFSQLTDHRYDRLLLGKDMGLSTAAQDEDILHSSLWRSDGTVDQLYLALRLAVAGELTPEAPLILDDALVRFDDTRLSTALRILQDEAAQRQVILFTCQHREKTLLQSEASGGN